MGTLRHRCYEICYENQNQSVTRLKYEAPTRRIMADAESWMAAIENRDLLNKAAAIHSRGTKRDFQSACWLKVTWDYPTVPLEAIAAHRKTTVDDVYHLLHIVMPPRDLPDQCGHTCSSRDPLWCDP